MRQFSNCLNALLFLLALPIYLLIALAAMVSMVSLVFSISPNWLPHWLQFIITLRFLLVAGGLAFWYSFVYSLHAQGVGGLDMVWLDTMLRDGISGYLLWAGLAVAAVVLF